MNQLFFYFNGFKCLIIKNKKKQSQFANYIFRRNLKQEF